MQILAGVLGLVIVPVAVLLAIIGVVQLSAAGGVATDGTTMRDAFNSVPLVVSAILLGMSVVGLLFFTIATLRR